MLNIVETSPLLPISLYRVKTHLRIDHTADDENLELLIHAATALVEHEIGRSLLTKVWKRSGSPTPTTDGSATLALPYPPLIQILSVHELGHKRSVRPVRRYIIEWEKAVPTILFNGAIRRVEVLYQAGYGSRPNDVPAPIRQAILLLVAEMYENRTSEGKISSDSVLKTLLAPYIITSLS